MTAYQSAVRNTRHGAQRKLIAQPFLIANLVLLAGAMIAGGASRENLIPTAILETAALAMLPWAVWRASSIGHFHVMKWPLTILGAAIFISAAQLVPLPPQWWTKLPQQHQVQAVYKAAGIVLPWRPLSLTPDLTLRSALS
jgi:hypothetical protein